ARFRFRCPPMTPDPQLLDLLERWEDLRARGATPTPEDLCRDCPERVTEGRALLRDLEAMDPPADTAPEPAAAPTGGPEAGGEAGAPAAALAGSRYRLVKFHAKGGQGEVYVARDEALRREVALKRIQARHRGQAEVARRFVREAEVSGRLQHPGIVPVYDL